MRNKICYEWKCETVSPCENILSDDAEIIDLDFSDSLKEFFPLERYQRICLVRDVGNDYDGLLERDHAYIRFGVLDSKTIEDCHKVPKRFHNEVKKQFQQLT